MKTPQSFASFQRTHVGKGSQIVTKTPIEYINPLYRGFGHTHQSNQPKSLDRRFPVHVLVLGATSWNCPCGETPNILVLGR